MKKYVIDACALIDLSKNYNMSKTTFRSIWENIDKMIDQGSLISSSEVKDELMDDDLIKWKKVHSKMFIPLDRKVQEIATNILGLFPNLIQMKATGNSNADPFLIALAIKESASVITDEGHKNSSNPSIPDVCDYYGIDYIKSIDFVNMLIE